MAERIKQINTFLQGTEWADANREPLAGDASDRRYLRLRNDPQTAVLMDAKADAGAGLRSFIDVDSWLVSLGLSAPQILHANIDQGLLLLEDLGDDLFARVVHKNPALETPLYQVATDVLVTLHQTPPPKDMAAYDPAVMAERSALAYHWYLRGSGQPYKERASAFQAEFQRLLAKHCAQCDVLIQRDYHAENLLWLPERKGVARVGLLDFQDAMVGHRAYDLVSVLQDARRDVSLETEAAMIERYIQTTGVERDSFTTAYAVLGVQRNLRIIGVFARLCLYSGKAHYVDFMPRVWDFILRDLDHPALSSIRPTLLGDLPPPDPHLMKKLKDQCATIPTL